MPRTWLSVDLRTKETREILDKMVTDDRGNDPEVTISSFVRNLIRKEFNRRREALYTPGTKFPEEKE